MKLYRLHFMRVLLILEGLIPKIIVSFCCKYKLLVNPSYKLRQQVLYYSLFKLFRLGIQSQTLDKLPRSLILVQRTEHSGLGQVSLETTCFQSCKTKNLADTRGHTGTSCTPAHHHWSTQPLLDHRSCQYYILSVE